jgi:SEC-C motif-containing protein
MIQADIKNESETPVQAEAESSEHVHGPDCSHGHQTVQTYVRGGPKVGRNDPCSCGSGKKFKKCCGGSQSELTH